jgi:DNA polymerase
MGESSADVSGGAQERKPEVEALAAEAFRHLAWLQSAGVAELPPPPTMEQLARPGAFQPTEVATDSAASPRPVERRPDDAMSRDPAPRDGAGTAAAASAGRPLDMPAASLAGEKGCGSPALLAIRQELGDCRRCKLAAGRRRLVFGVGNPAAELVFVGEGPGEDEDRQGEPFVGRAGQLLTRMIEAMGFARGDVYIANVVKCRPPGNRNPEPDEIEACEPFLRAQLAAIHPRIIVALGKFAAQTLLRDATPISRLRGRWATYEGVKLMPTFHPAYLLRSPDEKKKAWEDLQLVMKDLGKSPRR